MHARVISETDACKGLFVHWCAQPERPFGRMHATDFWATDARKVWGKSRMRATYIPDTRNPFNHEYRTTCMGNVVSSLHTGPSTPFWTVSHVQLDVITSTCCFPETCVLLCFIKPILENRYVRFLDFIVSEPRETPHDPRSPTSQPHPVPPWITWGVRILTLHLNYVAGYTDPLLFLFERTYNYYVDNQELVPWRLRRLGKSKIRSASYVRVLSYGRIPWNIRSQLSWNLPPPTTQSNTCLFLK